MSRFRVTIERRNGTFDRRDIAAPNAADAAREAMIAYTAKYGEPTDGESHWIISNVELPEVKT